MSVLAEATSVYGRNITVKTFDDTAVNFIIEKNEHKPGIDILLDKENAIRVARALVKFTGELPPESNGDIWDSLAVGYQFTFSDAPTRNRVKLDDERYLTVDSGRIGSFVGFSRTTVTYRIVPGKKAWVQS